MPSRSNGVDDPQSEGDGPVGTPPRTVFGTIPTWVDPWLLERTINLSEALVVQSTTGEIVAANERACSILRMSWSQMSGVTSMDARWRAITPDGLYLPGEQHPAMIALQSGTAQVGRLMGVDVGPEHPTTWLRVDATPQLQDGAVVGVVAVFVDVTGSDVGRAAEGTLGDAFRLVTERSQDIISRHSPTGEYIYVSPRCMSLLGYSPLELVGKSPYDLIHPDDVERASRSHGMLLSGPTAVGYRIRRKDGSYAEVETVSQGISDQYGRLVEIQCSTRDESEINRLRSRIFEADRLREESQRSSQHIQSVLDHLPEGLLVLDPDRIVLNANLAACFLLSHQDLPGQPFDAVFEGAPRKPTGEVFLDGRWVTAAETRLDVTGDWIVVVTDVTETIVRHLELAELALTDSLTGLRNRTAAMDMLQQHLDDHEMSATLFVNLDGFKAVNDRFGHVTGDAVLLEVARRIAGRAQDADLVGRYGGDEFLVLMPPGTPKATVEKLAQDVIADIRVPILAGGATVEVGASIGIAEAAEPLTPTQVLRAADAAMYWAKTAGNSFRWAELP